MTTREQNEKDLAELKAVLEKKRLENELSNKKYIESLRDKKN